MINDPLTSSISILEEDLTHHQSNCYKIRQDYLWVSANLDITLLYQDYHILPWRNRKTFYIKGTVIMRE